MVLFLGDSNDLPQSISFVLKVEWPELSLAHAAEAREEGIEIVHWEKPDTVMFALDLASV